MTTAYLILAHHQPNLLSRLISRLPAGDAVFVHLDARSSLQDFQPILDAFKDHVFFIPARQQTLWGSFSLVEATLNLLNSAGEGFDYYVLLSGQDYPVASPDQIRSFFQLHNGKSFIEYRAMPCPTINERQDGLYRINRFHRFDGKTHSEFPPYSRKKVLNPLFNAWANWYFRKVRPMPLGMKPYWGSQWWMLHKSAVLHINRLTQDPQVVSFFRNTWIPDEVFFQTLLLHGDASLQQMLVNQNFRFIKWPTEGDKLGFICHPTVLTEADIPLIRESDCLFARKFDEQASKEVLNWIDQHIDRQVAVSA